MIRKRGFHGGHGARTKSQRRRWLSVRDTCQTSLPSGLQYGLPVYERPWRDRRCGSGQFLKSPQSNRQFPGGFCLQKLAFENHSQHSEERPQIQTYEVSSRSGRSGDGSNPRRFLRIGASTNFRSPSVDDRPASRETKDSAAIEDL